MFEILLYIIAISSVILITIFFLYIVILNPRQIQILEECMDKEFYDEAETILLRIIKNDPNNFKCLDKIAFIYSKTDRESKAIPIYEQIIKIKNVDPVIKAQTLYKLVQYYHQVNLLQKASHYIKQLLQFDPDNEQYLMMLGNIYYDTEDFDSAINTFNKLLLLNPRHVVCLQRLGDTYQALNMNSLTYKYYSLALDLDSKNPSLLLKIGEICEKMKNYTQAIEFFNKIEKFNNFHYTFYAYTHLATIYFILADKHKYIKYLEQARTITLEKSIPSIHKDDILNTYYKIGKHYIEESNILIALKEWDRILAIDRTFKDIQELYNTYFSLQLDDFFKDITTLSGKLKQHTISVFLSSLGYTTTSIQSFGEEVLDFYVSNFSKKWIDISKRKIIFSFWCSIDPFPIDIILRLIDCLDTHMGITKIYIISAGPILSEIKTLSTQHAIYIYDQNNIKDLFDAHKKNK